MTRTPSPPRSAPRRPPMDARIRARRHEVLRERARRRGRVIASIAVLLLLTAIAVGVAGSPLFAIADIRVVGVTGDQQNAARDASGLDRGDNLLWADLATAVQRVEGLPWVRSADVRRLPPSTVEVRVVPREPVAVVRLPHASWLVDADGVVVAGGARDGLADVDAPHSVVPGVGVQVRDAALRNALAAHAQLPAALRAQIERYEARSARDLRLHLVGGIVVRFGVAEDVGAKARSVTLLLEQAQAQAQRHAASDEPADGFGVAEIDVRAPDNPVLVPAVGD